ncbi:alpha-amylase family protein [Marisediminicola sp. LYQ85]|uniref:alpha-amylase family protein n=1 Tax=Marisediminicola sp. LYQ85 TaxID=3391062 RepID=UPI0039833D62
MPDLAPPTAHRTPDWVAHSIWWHIYPLGFAGADTTGVDRTPPADAARANAFERMSAWLDYALELGVSGILLGPVFTSETHGYDTTDYFEIDPRLGSMDDFRAFCADARGRGIRIMLDGVFNHVGRSFPPFERAQAGGEELSWFRPIEGGDDASPRFENFEGHDALVALNHNAPAVRDLVVDVMNHWLDAGADAWRLDAAYAVPSDFWAEVLPRVRAAHPDVFVAGEVIHGDYAQLVVEGTLDAVTQYEAWKATRNSIAERNFFELAWTLERHNEFLDTFVPFTFVGNHDVTRLGSAVAEEPNLPHALVVLFTIGGTPAIYYGDEQGFVGEKEDRAGGDDAVRPAFPDSPAELADEGWPLYRVHQELIGLRRRAPWLHSARATALHTANTVFVYEARAAASDPGRGDDAGSAGAASAVGAAGRSIVVALNIGDDEVTVTADADAAASALRATPTLLAGTAHLDASDPGGRGVILTIPAHGWAVLGQ